MAKTKPVASEMTDPANWRVNSVGFGLNGIVPTRTIEHLEKQGIHIMAHLDIALIDGKDIGLGVLAEKVRGHLQTLKRPAKTQDDVWAATGLPKPAPATTESDKAFSDGKADHDGQTFEIAANSGPILSSQEITEPTPESTKPKSPAERGMKPGASAIIKWISNNWQTVRVIEQKRVFFVAVANGIVADDPDMGGAFDRIDLQTFVLTETEMARWWQSACEELATNGGELDACIRKHWPTSVSI